MADNFRPGADEDKDKDDEEEEDEDEASPNTLSSLGFLSSGAELAMVTASPPILMLIFSPSFRWSSDAS
jgi:hypothetical protein